MGLQLAFADSFAHYDTSGIGLKWDTPGGIIDTSPSHVRTGPRSLRIEAGNAPTKLIPGGGIASYSAVGLAWQTEVLDDEVIFALYNSSATEIQLSLSQFSDGHLELRNTTGVLIQASAPGVLTAGPFWYIELNVLLNSGIGTVQCVVTVTNDSTHVPTQVINATDFVTSQISWDTVILGGPGGGVNHAWVADFYMADQWDGLGDPLAPIGAPKIYGLNVPNQDGVNYMPPNHEGQTICWDGTLPPWWSQVNDIPQDTAAPIFHDSTDGFFVPGSALTFLFDVSSVPGGSPVAAVQLTMMYQFNGGDIGSTGAGAAAFTHRSGDPDNDHANFGFVTLFAPISPGQTIGFQFFTFALTQNPWTSAGWNLSDLTGPTAVQFGPGLQGNQ